MDYKKNIRLSLSSQIGFPSKLRHKEDLAIARNDCVKPLLTMDYFNIEFSSAVVVRDCNVVNNPTIGFPLHYRLRSRTRR